jgi:hypothetical protein
VGEHEVLDGKEQHNDGDDKAHFFLLFWCDCTIILSTDYIWFICSFFFFVDVTKKKERTKKKKTQEHSNYSGFVTEHFVCRCEGVQYCEATRRKHRSHTCEVTLF